MNSRLNRLSIWEAGTTEHKFHLFFRYFSKRCFSAELYQYLFPVSDCLNYQHKNCSQQNTQINADGQIDISPVSERIKEAKIYQFKKSKSQLIPPFSRRNTILIFCCLAYMYLLPHFRKQRKKILLFSAASSSSDISRKSSFRQGR